MPSPVDFGGELLCLIIRDCAVAVRHPKQASGGVELLDVPCGLRRLGNDGSGSIRDLVPEENKIATVSELAGRETIIPQVWFLGGTILLGR
jgi:hypothetical protein